MLAKVWRNNQFTGHQGRMLGNNSGSLCQACYLVRLTTSRGESLLKVCEKISVGWIVQSSSSFEMSIVMVVLFLPMPFTALVYDLPHQRGRFVLPDHFRELFMTPADLSHVG